MSDNLRRYRAIRDALTQGYPGQPTGSIARHLTTLAVLLSGIVGSKSTQLLSIAAKIPDSARPESRVKRLTRWLDDKRILEEVYFLPYDVSPTWEAACAQRGLDHTRYIRASHGAVLLGRGVSRAPASGQQSGDSRGGVSLVSKALPDRDLFLRPEKPRFPYA
jgi:hypothetical protein